jgi:hypothetical protein
MRKHINRFLTIVLAAIVFGPLLYAGITTTKTAGNISYQGSVPDAGDLVTYLGNIANNGSPAYGNVTTTSAVFVSGGTLSAPQILNGYIMIPQNTAGAMFLAFASAAQIVAGIPGAAVNNSWTTTIANFAPGTVTMSAGAGCTLSGTLTIAQSAVRTFWGGITAIGATPTCAISSLYAIPSATL